MGRKSREKKERREAAARLRSVTTEQVDDLLAALNPEDDGAAGLPQEQRQLSFEIVQTWAYLMERLRKGKLTIAEMRRLAGIAAEMQKRREQAPEKPSDGGDAATNELDAQSQDDGGGK